jgi:hypothetical protein
MTTTVDTVSTVSATPVATCDTGDHDGGTGDRRDTNDGIGATNDGRSENYPDKQ